jgi:pimeloyl-ACP methyl ester carboxylesterase
MCLIAACAAAAALRPGRAVAAQVPAAGQCAAVTLPAALAPGAAADQTLAGTLCQPSDPGRGPLTVDVLTSGATYNQSYWDWPQDPSLYSYVDKTLRAGRATFAYDRAGTGASSHPPGTAVTLAADAYELHQAVAWLRAQGYAQVNSVGHSLGSIIAIAESAAYNDVDRLVLTGFLHAPNPGYAHLISFLYPAALDPQFAGAGLRPGYLTSAPGSRGVFYSSAADPAVIAYDEQHKDTVTTGEIGGALEQIETPPPLNVSDTISVPVLLIVGQQDKLMCGGPVPDCADPDSVRAAEAPYYRSAASLTVQTVPDTGHDLALHPSADQSFTLINRWLVSN